MKHEFLRVLKEEWYPALRRAEFKGASQNFRRVKEPFVHCIWIQATSDGRGCFANLGVHLNFIPVSNAIASSELPDVEKIDQLSCEIKSRVSPNTAGDSRWSYGNSVAEAKQNARNLIAVYWNQGEPYFGKFSELPGVFESMTPADISNWDGEKWRPLFPLWSAPRAAVFVARVYAHLGDHEKAAAFSKAGLPYVQKGVPSVKKALRDVLRELMSSSVRTASFGGRCPISRKRLTLL